MEYPDLFGKLENMLREFNVNLKDSGKEFRGWITGDSHYFQSFSKTAKKSRIYVKYKRNDVGELNPSSISGIRVNEKGKSEGGIEIIKLGDEKNHCMYSFETDKNVMTFYYGSGKSLDSKSGNDFIKRIAPNYRGPLNRLDIMDYNPVSHIVVPVLTRDMFINELSKVLKDVYKK